MSALRVSFGLSARLLIALLAFGAIPLGLSIAVGFLVSRDVITEQAAGALRELTARQAVHLATELRRQRLILRTIVGQLPHSPEPVPRRPAALAELLGQSLPEDGVFDGLRLVTETGQALATVSLRDARPEWPPRMPAADWRTTSVTVHRDGPEALAYVVAVPLWRGPDPTWLEAHVRAQDFGRIFAIPRHMAGAIESAVFDRAGAPLLVAPPLAMPSLAAAVLGGPADSVSILRTEIDGASFLVATAPVEGAGWTYAAGLPLEIALAPLARLRNAALVGTALLILLIMLTALLAARSIGTPLRDLAAAARHLGETGAYQPIAHAGSDEVGHLVRSFNRMAEDLQQSRAEVERLHAQEMQRAQQLATVGELASGIAHEIRNPLTGVLGALELATRRLPADDSSRPLLAEAERQLRRIEGTTAQLLRYARPPEPREVVTDANLLVQRALQLVAPQAESAGVALSAETSPGPALVRVDPELMVQVLVNLMLNAIQAMDPGGRLTVWAAPHPPEVWLGVRDTGPGVPLERRAAIFRPFYTTKHQGTGLGLTISQQIVQLHAGALRHEDTPGGGATFVVSLPLAERGQGTP